MGNAFFVKLFNGRIIKLSFGHGGPFITIGNLNINLLYFNSYSYNYSVNEKKVYKPILIHLGGIIFNLIFGFMIWLSMSMKVVESNKVFYELFYVSIFSIAINILPHKIGNINSEGKQICELLGSRIRRSTMNIDIIIKGLDEQIELKPYEVKLYNIKGNALSDFGRNEEAIDCYLKAIDICPNYSMSYYNLACVYSIVNRKDDAIDYLEKAINLDEAWKNSAKADEDFYNIRADEEFLRITSS